MFSNAHCDEILAQKEATELPSAEENWLRKKMCHSGVLGSALSGSRVSPQRVTHQQPVTMAVGKGGNKKMKKGGKKKM